MKRRLNSEDVHATLFGLFIERGVPEYIRTDNGSECTAKAVRGWLSNVGVKALYIEPESPRENGYNESCIDLLYWGIIEYFENLQ